MARLKRISLIFAIALVILIPSFYLLTTHGPVRHVVGNFARRTAAHMVLALNLDPQGNGLRRGLDLGPSVTARAEASGLNLTRSNPTLETTPMTPATGPLRVDPANPRYFTDGSGKAILLTGSHTWANFQDQGGTNPPPVFDYSAYLDFLTSHNQNFFRLWTWEQAQWTVRTIDNNYQFAPLPYQRPGPGTALDGKPKFDLTKFDQAYFDRLRSRVIEAGNRGIYISIMLFDGWSVSQNKGGFTDNNPWHGHPFNRNNNINGIDGDPNHVDSGETIETLTIPQITSLQEAYVRKVIDTISDQDNVLFEICNESNGSDQTPWQYHMISLIKTYEAGKPKQHPVGMTAEYPGGMNDTLFASPADWISPAGDLNNPVVADGSKVILYDTDHLCGICGDRPWVWKSFTRGLNPVFMDGYDGKAYGIWPIDPNDPFWEIVRTNLGYVRTFANRMNLVAMQPRGDLASTGYCLANPVAGEAEYLVYAPDGGTVSVDLSGVQGALQVEWFNPSNGLYTDGGTTNGGGNHSFQPPFSGDAVLYIHQAVTTASNNVYLPFVRRTSQSVVSQNSFSETFDGMPSSPQPWKPANWDVTVHSRDATYLDTLTAMQADHGTQCEPPPATHPTNTYDGAVFICHDHMMTAINDPGYGVIYLTPDHMVDFSSGEAVIKFDMSTRTKSSRDWIDLWVTPFADNLQLTLDSWLPDLNGPPRRAIHIRMEFPNGNTYFTAEVISNFNPQPVDQNSTTGYEASFTPSPTRRDTFELDISRTHLRFGMPKYNLWWIDQDIPSLDWAQGVVQFGHHSYNPEKACNNDGTCGPNTWHWDNVYISPAVPFTIIRANQGYVNAATGPLVSLAAPAPANAYLRFAGIGNSIEVSFDSGTTWKPAQVQAQMEQIEEHFQSYWMPIPVGVSQVSIRGKSWWGGDWQVRDISVWSLNTK